MEGKIVIKISESQDAHFFSEGELIHGNVFDKLVTLINQLATKASNCGNSESSAFAPIEYHDSIAVFGERGVGKTSFLRSLAHHYMEDSHSDVCVLPCIDPTLIEEKGHVFLLILSLICNQVDKCLKEDECIPNTAPYDKRKKWNQLLMKLAKGLPSLDHIGQTMENTSWQDDSYIMEKGIDVVYSAHQLYRNFRSLVQEALKIISSENNKKNAFLLILDDIDVQFQRGWSVLETIRKYLAIPEIITVISGNESLYSKNVRKAQWKNFGKALLLNENTKEDRIEYNALVSELEEQYMLKLFKADHRFTLRRVYDYMVTLENGENLFQIENAGGVKNLDNYYDSLLITYGIKGANVRKLYKIFLLSLPIRTQIHFLTNHPDPSNIDGEHGIDAFYNRMRTSLVDVDGLLFNTIDIEILKYLMNNKFIEEAYQLLPNMENIDVDTTLVGLSLKFAQFSKQNPMLIFDYFIRIGLIRNLTNVLGYEAKQSIVGLIKYSVSLKQRELKDLVGDGLAYLLGAKANVRAIGHLGIYATALRDKGGNVDKRHRIDFELSKLENNLDKVIGYLPLCVFKYSDKQGSRLYYSVYALLAAIGDILKCSSKEEMQRILKDYTKERSYVIMDTEYSGRPDDLLTSFDYIDSFSDETITDLFDQMNKWKLEYAKKSITPYLLGRISTRFYHAMDNIMVDYVDNNVADIINLFVSAFYNSVLICEALEALKSTEDADPDWVNKININNVRKSTEVYEKNKIIADEHKDQLPLYTWLAKCPLLIPFTDTSHRLYECLKEVYLYDTSVENSLIKKEVFRSANNKKSIKETVEKIRKNSNLSLEEILTGNIASVVLKLKEYFTNVSDSTVQGFRENYEKYIEK